MSALTNRAVTVIHLGRMGFMAAHDVQMRFARKHLDELADKPYTYGENALLLVEHPPVYTVGLRTKDYTAEDEAYLKSTGAEFYKTNRGGLITFHGPGQLVAYPILNLQHFKPSMKWYVCKLEETMMKTLQSFGLKGRTTDQTGVWVGKKKIGSIVPKVSSGKNVEVQDETIMLRPKHQPLKKMSHKLFDKLGTLYSLRVTRILFPDRSECKVETTVTFQHRDRRKYRWGLTFDTWVVES
ncbi:putative lipoyltransferase 2, mitochondrial [Bulinus truncatus]|nr:putative lipoyltransferase 2, mitochondrial [Bulinus truncatus]